MKKNPAKNIRNFIASSNWYSHHILKLTGLITVHSECVLVKDFCLSAQTIRSGKG